MGMQALDASAGSSDTTRRSGTGPVGWNQLVPLSCVTFMGPPKRLGVDRCFRIPDTSTRLKGSNESVEFTVDQPEPGRHGCAVIEQRCVLDHNRSSVLCSDSYHEAAPWRTAKQFSDHGDVISRRLGSRRTHDSQFPPEETFRTGPLSTSNGHPEGRLSPAVAGGRMV